MQEAAGNPGQQVESAFPCFSFMGTGAGSTELSERHWGFLARGFFVQGGSAKAMLMCSVWQCLAWQLSAL